MTFKIYYRQHIYTAANILTHQLRKLGHSAEMVTCVNPLDDAFYIIYCAFCVENFPRKYIVVQTEVSGSKWFDNNYYRILNGANAVWEYSPENMKAYALATPTFLVTPGIMPMERTCERDIEVLFYGALNIYRKGLLNRLPVTRIAENIYGAEMYALLERSKIVLNIRFYRFAPLETFRINEALGRGCHIISQPAPHMERYKHLVYFATTSEEFKTGIEKILPLKFDYDLSVLDNFEEVKRAVEVLL